MNSHRWNIEETSDGIRICKGDHERSEACQWVEYVTKDFMAEELRHQALEIGEAHERAEDAHDSK